jgi:hypothetical protein
MMTHGPWSVKRSNATRPRVAEERQGLDDAHLLPLRSFVPTYPALTEDERARVLARLQAEGAMNGATSTTT